jgi:endonuclease YncB( thermonuclease family)
MNRQTADARTGQCPANERMWKRYGVSAYFVTVAVALFLSVSPANADVRGPVCVENGGVISVNGKRSSGRCVDGTIVRLYGVLAPGLEHECRIGAGEVWRCGLASAAALLQAVKGREVECRGNSNDSKGRLVALCFIAGRSLNQFMVELGWAEADRGATSMFNDFEQEARQARRGLWSSEYDPTDPDS